MKKLNLCLHAGASEVSAEVLDAVPTPPATPTWSPVPHGGLLRAVKSAMTGGGLSIVNESHGLTRAGDRYFGLLQVEGDNEDYGLVVGVRNSHDKSFPVGLAIGCGVFVCDNLAFSGEISLTRKHTRWASRDIEGLACRAIGNLITHRGQQDRRIAVYKERPIDDREAHDVIVRAIDARAIVASQLPEVLREWRKPSHPEFLPRNAWSLFNAFTEVAKGNLSLCLHRTQKLHGLMDLQCGLAV